MKNYFALPLFAFLASCTTCYSYTDTTSKVVLADIASIHMPSEAQKFEIGLSTSYAYGDDRFIYQFSEIKEDKVGGENFNDDDLDKFYEGFIKGFINKINGILIRKNSFFIDGFIGKEIYFSAVTSENVPVLFYTRVILLNKHCFSMVISTFSENENSLYSAKEAYFGSFKLEKDKSEIEQTAQDRHRNNQKDQYYNSGYELGRRVGKMIPLFFCSFGSLVILVCLFFTFRYFNKKSKNNNAQN